MSTRLGGNTAYPEEKKLSISFVKLNKNVQAKAPAPPPPPRYLMMAPLWLYDLALKIVSDTDRA